MKLLAFLVVLGCTQAIDVKLFTPEEVKQIENVIIQKIHEQLASQNKDVLKSLLLDKRGLTDILSSIKDGAEKLVHSALPTVEQLAKELAPIVLSKGAEAAIGLIGKRGIGDIFNSIKSGLQTAVTTVESGIQSVLPTAENLVKQYGPDILKSAASSLVTGALTSLVGKRDDEKRGLIANMLQSTMNTILKGVGQELGVPGAGAAGSTDLGAELLGSVEKDFLNALKSLSAGKREVTTDPLMQHFKEEINSVFDKLKLSVQGAENIATHLENNLRTTAIKVAQGHNIKDLAQNLLSVLEGDVDQMLEQGTFEVDLDKLIGNIVPNVVTKLFTHCQTCHHRRGLLSLLTGGVKDLVNIVGGTAVTDIAHFTGELTNGLTKLVQPTLNNVQSMAESFLKTAGSTTGMVAKEAVKFFQPFKNQLGSVFTDIEALANKLTA